MAEPTLIQERGAEVLMEGDEFVRVYARTDKLVFGVATFQPGQRGPSDPGHPGAQEVAYVVQGQFVFEFPEIKRFLELRAGDAVLIPEGEPHGAINISQQVGIICWCIAPNVG